MMKSNEEHTLKTLYESKMATKWRHKKDNATRIEFNGAEKVLLGQIKAAIDPTLAICQRLSGMNLSG